MHSLFSFTKYSLARKFFYVSLIILFVGMLVIGFFVGGQIQLRQFNNMLENSPLGKNIVAFKLWLRDGEIIYSPNEKLMGVHFPISQALQQSFNGAVISEMSKLNKPEHAYEKLYWDTLIEIYAPVRDQTTGDIIAVVEFYLLPDDLRNSFSPDQRLGDCDRGNSPYVFPVSRNC